MRRTSWMWAWAGVVAVVAGTVVGCQAVAKLETRNADPIPSGCRFALDSTGNGRIRLANVAPVAGAADFCVRPSGTASWGRPLLRDGGDDPLCRTGLAYGEVTVPFGVAAGSIDVKVIPAGQTCAAAATSEHDGIAVGDNGAGAPVVTLMRWGGGSSSEALAALPELSPGKSSVQASHFRLVNATSGGRSANFGVTDARALPATVQQIAGPAVAAGSVQAAGSGPLGTIDSAGYLTILGSTFTLAASYADDSANNAVALMSTPSGADDETWFLIGDPNDTQNSHPVRFLRCEDSPTLTMASVDGGPVPDAPTDDDRKSLASCTLSRLKTFSVDTANVGLYGQGAPFNSDRAAAAPAILAARTSDVMCIIEASDKPIRTAIANAGKQAGTFPYSFMVDTAVTTLPTDPADQRPAPGSPPCGNSDASTVSGAFNCALQSCTCSQAPCSSSDPTTAQLNQGTACLTNSCASKFGPLIHLGQVASASPQVAADQACYGCIAVSLSGGYPIGTAQNDCSNVTQAPFSYLGQNPTMILSHYPIASTSYYVLPSTFYRRTILKAQVQLEDQTVDFFCAQLSSPLLETSLPYTGNYGRSGNSSNPPPESGWEDEQDLQADRAIAWMKSEADKDGLPAVITGDWHATIGTGGDAGPVALSSQSPEIPQKLDRALGKGGPFTLAVPPGYTPVCDYCGATQNPYNTQTQTSYEFVRTYTYNFPANAALSDTLWATENVVTVQGNSYTPAPAGGKGPMSEYFPHNVVLLRPR